MCGISGIVSPHSIESSTLLRQLKVQQSLIEHRGPDGHGTWVSGDLRVGLGHRRLSIIDLSDAGKQPMIGDDGSVLTYNGEIYNFIELRNELAGHWQFKSHSDSEVILAAYSRWGADCIQHLRGMFSFAIWDEKKKSLFCARDRFGIKPFYYTIVDGCFYFASEAKALVPFLREIETDPDALAEYITFQYTIGEQTLFKNIKQLMPGQALIFNEGKERIWRYWDVHYSVDFDHSEKYFVDKLDELINESVNLHLRSDVPIGSYLSGGIDSSLIALLAKKQDASNSKSFHGKFTDHPGYDESHYARIVSDSIGNELHEIDITSNDFKDNIEKVIYYLDFPVAGPGSFPQYMVSQLASKHLKVTLGGQGGDEIFGGYARYLLAYFEQCIKAAIDGTYKNGNYLVTIESIIPNLGMLREYRPLIKEFWREGLFGPLDERYLRLVDRSNDMKDEVNWNELSKENMKESFKNIFNNDNNVGKENYFDKMTHFDFKCLLPALLHVEDRMSMAHGLESRVPLLDHKLVEFVAQIPASIKFEGGKMKHLLKQFSQELLPKELLQRRDKMGFPVPLKEWFHDDLKELVLDVFHSDKAHSRSFMNSEAILANFDSSSQFSRKTWGLLSLELWHQRFHDQADTWRKLGNGSC